MKAFFAVIGTEHVIGFLKALSIEITFKPFDWYLDFGFIGEKAIWFSLGPIAVIASWNYQP